MITSHNKCSSYQYKIDQHIQLKRQHGSYYQSNLTGIIGFQLPLIETEYATNIYWVFGLVAESEDLAKNAVEKLSSSQIGTRPFFWCMHEQPVFKKMGLFKNESYPNAEKLARNGFYLPSGLRLSENDQNIVINILLERNK